MKTIFALFFTGAQKDYFAFKNHQGVTLTPFIKHINKLAPLKRYSLGNALINAE